MFKIVTKLKHLRAHIRKLHGQHFKGIENKFHHLYGMVINIQTKLQSQPTASTLQEVEDQLTKEYLEFRCIEEKILQQRVKQHFIQCSYENSRFFHAIVKQRNRQNFVHKIIDIEDKVCDTQDDIAMAFVEFYRSLMGTSHQVLPLDDTWIFNGPVLTDFH